VTEPVWKIWPTPPKFAKTLGVKPEKIIGFIQSGELIAIDVSAKPGVGRPRYRIPPSAIADFIARRTVTPRLKPPRRTQLDDGGVEYF